MEPTISSTALPDDDETVFRLLLDFATELDDDFAELLLDLDEISPSFELFAEVDESLPQATNTSANKKRDKVFFIIVNITHFYQKSRRRCRHSIAITNDY